ncbi:MAG TPA: 3-hydroxybutyryl-CoA dehydrogenase, partial [Chitinophagaceae bacterium]|nr:3-hydroxybutyryl-CoA dehydrogenase [Chitinophagaceae bacterium]
MYRVETICVCGAGTMGSGIAQVAAQAGFYTILFDLNAAVLDKAAQSIHASLNQLEAKGRLQEPAADVYARIQFTGDLQLCIADLIIEAIIEQTGAKVALFNQLAELNHSETIFATNTSSISVSTIAEKVVNPSRVAGMHFFNPAPLMKLVEVIRGEQTNEAVIDMLVDIAKRMQKVPVVCKDAPGFIVNRVARHYYLEAMQMVEKGLADPATIDQVMEATGFKMGSFKLMDLIGMDINYSVSNIVWDALGKPLRLTPSPIQQQKLALGELG